MTKRTPFWTYFYWLVFCSVLFLASEVLRMAETFRYYRTPLQDIAANYGLLGLVLCIVAAIAAVALTAIDMATRAVKWPVRVALFGVVFSLFVAAWLNIVRLLLATFGVKLPIAPSVQLVCFAVLGILIFVLRTEPVLQWMGSQTRQYAAVTWVVVGASIVLTGYLFWEPHNRGVPPPVTLRAAGEPRPNVVMIVLDGLTSRDMSLYGYHLVTTPNLDRLTKTWTIYDKANSTATSTRGVMPTLLTGHYPYMDDWYRYGDLARSGTGWLSLPSALQSLGYETARIGGGGGYPPNIYHLHTGFSKWVSGGSRIPGAQLLEGTLFTRLLMLDPMLAEYAWPKSASSNAPTSAAIGEGNWFEPVYANAEQYFKEKAAANDGVPFFAYLHMERPNGPYWGNEFAGTLLPLDAGFPDRQSQLPYRYAVYTSDQQPQIDRLRLRYDENIRKADQQVGHLIETLQDLGLYDQTMIVITADHGSNFVEGHQGYSTSILAATEHSVPLLIKYPRQIEGRRVPDLVSTVDVMPTVLDVVGAEYPTDMVDGISLRSAKLHQSDRIIFVRRVYDPSTFAALNAEFKLVHREGKLSLFNLSVDPWEQNTLKPEVAPALYDALKQYALRLSPPDGALVMNSVDATTP